MNVIPLRHGVHAVWLQLIQHFLEQQATLLGVYIIYHLQIVFLELLCVVMVYYKGMKCVTVDIPRCVYQRVRRQYIGIESTLVMWQKRRWWHVTCVTPFLLYGVYCCIPSSPVLLLGCYLVSTPLALQSLHFKWKMFYTCRNAMIHAVMQQPAH